MPLLTPNAMLFLNSNLTPQLQPHHVEIADLHKRAEVQGSNMEPVDQRAPAQSTQETRTVHNEELVETRHLLVT